MNPRLTFASLAFILAISPLPTLAQNATATPDKTAEWQQRKAAWEQQRTERFTKADTDGDGGLSKDEFIADLTARATERFAETDTNTDGKLTLEELDAAREKMRARFGANKGQPPHAGHKE